MTGDIENAPAHLAGHSGAITAIVRDRAVLKGVFSLVPALAWARALITNSQMKRVKEKKLSNEIVVTRYIIKCASIILAIR